MSPSLGKRCFSIYHPNGGDNDEPRLSRPESIGLQEVGVELIEVLVVHLDAVFKELLPGYWHLSLQNVSHVEISVATFTKEVLLFLRNLQVAILSIEPYPEEERLAHKGYQ